MILSERMRRPAIFNQSDGVRRAVLFGVFAVVFLVCWILQPLQFLLGGVYPTATIVCLLLAAASIFWPAITGVWDWIDERFGSVAVFLVLFLIFGAASLIVWPVEQALATFYRILALVALAMLITSLGIRAAKAAGVTWTYKNLPLFRSTRAREAMTGIAFVAPWAFGFLAFSAVPIGLSLFASFTTWHLTNFPEWTGITNYKYMILDDPTFRIALGNTIWYVLVKVPVTIIASLLLALLMAQKVPGIKFFRTVFYMPTVITGVAAIFLWVWVLWPTGLLNTALNPFQTVSNWVTGGLNPILHAFSNLLGIITFGHYNPHFGTTGTGPILWFFNPGYTKPAMVIMSLWYIGAGSLILLASLVGIPRSLYEAADVEGAGPFRKFWSITIPMISPTLFFLILTNIIGAFQVFNSAYVISTASGVGTNPGDPDQSLLFYEVYLYTKFTALNMGYACALAWVVFMLILAITAVQLYLSRRWVYYESG